MSAHEPGRKADAFEEIRASMARQNAMLVEIKHRLEVAEKTVRALRMALEDSRK